MADLDIADHLESVEPLSCPADLAYSAMDPAWIATSLGWRSRLSIKEIAEITACEADILNRKEELHQLWSV